MLAGLFRFLIPVPRPQKKVPPGYAGGRVPPRRSRGGDGRRRVHRTVFNMESVHVADQPQKRDVS